jgi:hypothetical protein
MSLVKVLVRPSRLSDRFRQTKDSRAAGEDVTVVETRTDAVAQRILGTKVISAPFACWHKADLARCPT